MTSKELNCWEKESVKDYMKIIKQVDPNLSDRMRSHYKKQIVEILQQEKDQNLLYKLLGRIEEIEGEKEELKSQIAYHKR